MKRFFAMLVFLLALFGASSVWAEGAYVVEKGDTLSGIAKKFNLRTWRQIQELNKLEDWQCQIIIPGQKLLIPGGAKAETPVAPKGLRADAKPVKATSVVFKEKVVEVDEFWTRPGADKYREALLTGIMVLVNQIPGLSDKDKEEIVQGLVREISAGNFVWGHATHISRGGLVIEKYQDENGETKDREYKMLAMLCGGAGGSPIKLKKGPNGVISNWANEAHTEAGRIYSFRGVYIMIFLKCKNPALLEPIQKPGQPPPTQVFTPGEKPKEYREVVIERKEDILEHELNFGGGLWTNQDRFAKGAWWFAEYKLHLLKLSEDIWGGSVHPVVGIFAAGDLGRTDAKFNWMNYGIGPEAGAFWSGITSEGYPHSAQILGRGMYEWLHGRNDNSGYEKDEDHLKVGYYAEYLRRFDPKMMNVFYSEGWYDLSRKFHSTWKGDRASNRTTAAVGYKFHYDWTDEWATRLGIQLGYSPNHNIWGLNLNAEMRYDDWLIFGPSFDYTLASTLHGMAGGYAYGPFARVELKHLVRDSWTEKRTFEVRWVEKDLFTGEDYQPPVDGVDSTEDQFYLVEVTPTPAATFASFDADKAQEGSVIRGIDNLDDLVYKN